MSDEKRVFCLGPTLLDEAPMWSPGPMWSGDRELILQCQQILQDEQIQELWFDLLDKFNSKAMALGIESAIEHGADPGEMAKLNKGRGKRKK